MRWFDKIGCFIWMIGCLLSLNSYAQEYPNTFASSIIEPDLLRTSEAIFDTTNIVHNGELHYRVKTFGLERSASYLPKSGYSSAVYSEGIQQLNKTIISGYFSYEYARFNGIRWQLRNPVRQYSPLSVADSIKSDWRINTINLGTRIAAAKGHLRPALSIDYKASYAGKDTDPRSQSKSIHFQISPGAIWLVNDDLRIYGNLIYGYSKEDIDIIHKGSTKESFIFKFLGRNLMQTPEITNTFAYRYKTQNAGGNLLLSKQLTRDKIELSGQIIQSFSQAINDPYYYISTTDNTVIPIVTKDACMSQIHAFTQGTYNFIGHNKTSSKLSCFAALNKGAVSNEHLKKKVYENSSSNIGLNLEQITNSVVSKIGLSGEYTETESFSHHLLKESYQYLNLSAYTRIKHYLGSNKQLLFTPGYLFEFHTNNSFELISETPFILNNNILISELFLPDSRYFGSNKHRATLKSEIKASAKKHDYFLRFVLTYNNICETNASIWHSTCMIGLKF